jgi:class 3 adenylate cyclase/predicted ATPase
MKCSNCHAVNPDTGRFCTQCGVTLPTVCAHCGTENSSESNFCGGCGANLSRAADLDAAGAVSTGQRLTPTLEAAPNPELAGQERRHLTVAFCDIVDSTELARSLDPEDLNEVTRAYYKYCADAIRRFDGIIANYMGDGVMALFGYPRAHEDDAERAIRAALSILHGIKTADIRRDIPVRVRIGIATGLVVVGKDGADALTKEKSVVGKAPNLAAHLQAAAEPNGALISDATRQLVGDVFSLERTSIENLKGSTEPTTAWRVLSEKTATSRFAAHVTSLTSFVGREQEVALLADRWRQSGQSEGQVVFLGGEAGIGKSRIVETFRHFISDDAHHEVRYQCSPYHANSALFPVISQLESAADFVADDPPAVKLEKLENFLKHSMSNWEPAAPLFAELLSIPSAGHYPEADPDPQRRKERTLNAFVELLADMSSNRPVLLIFEDVHWADPTTLDLIGRTMLRVPEFRVLLVMTYRPEFNPPWASHPHVTALLLNRLGRRHCRAMVESIAHGKTLPGEVMEQIIAKTDGVPLFVEELTKTVLESGIVREQGAGWSLTGPLPSFAIPATLQDSLMARLDRLISVKEIAQVAATIGREFSYDLLAAVSPIPASDLKGALVRLAAAGLIFSRGAPPTASYIFKHALVQDAAYQTLLRSRRQQLHGQIGKVLETRFPEIAESQPEILAHHYTQAGQTGIAVEWWNKAGELAIRRSADLEAVRHFSRAIELIQLEPETHANKATELAIRIKLSGPLIATRGYVTPDLAENYARAWELCNEFGEDKSAFPVMYGQWVIPYVRGDMATALKNSEQFLRRAEQTNDIGLLMMGHRIYGSSLVWRGDTRQGSEHLDLALSLYRAPEHDQLSYVYSQHPRTAALAHLCLALQHQGHLDRAMAAGWEAISQAKRIEHFNSIAYALCFVSLLIMLRRDIPTLKRTAGELLQLAERYNASYWELWAKPMLGWIDAQEGNVEAGIQKMHESTEELQRQKANLWVPQTLLLEAEILGQVKEYRRAHRLLNEAQALIEPLDQRFYEAELHRVRGVIVLSEKADSAVGMASLDRAIEVAQRQNSRFLELRARMSKGRLSLKHECLDREREALSQTYHTFSEGLDTADLVDARALIEEMR